MTKHKVQFRVEPVRMSKLRATFNHQSSEKRKLSAKQNIDKDKTDLNIISRGQESLEKSFYDYLEQNNMLDKETNMPVFERSRSTDPTCMAEMVFSPSHAWLEENAPNWKVGKISEPLKLYMETTQDFLIKKYGEQFIHASWHLDEKTFHCHAFVVPTSTKQVFDNRKSKNRKLIDLNKISYHKQFSDLRATFKQARLENNSELTKLGKLQTEFSNHLIEKFPNFERGLKNSKRAHIKTHDFSKAVNATKIEIEKHKKVLSTPIDLSPFKLNKPMFGAEKIEISPQEFENLKKKIKEKDQLINIFLSSDAKIIAENSINFERNIDSLERHHQFLNQKFEEIQKENDEIQLKNERLIKENLQLNANSLKDKLTQVVQENKGLKQELANIRELDIFMVVKDFPDYSLDNYLFATGRIETAKELYKKMNSFFKASERIRNPIDYIKISQNVTFKQATEMLMNKYDGLMSNLSVSVGDTFIREIIEEHETKKQIYLQNKNQNTLISERKITKNNATKFGL